MSLAPVVRQVKDALDGVPIHVRQLAAMFKQHGSVHKRKNSDINDLDRVPPELRDGWRDHKWLPNDVVAAGKGKRPDPSEYLDADYISNHLSQFENGATRIYTSRSLLDWGPGNNQVPGNATNTAYVFPTDQLDNLMNQVDSPQELAQALGLPENFFEGADVQLRDFSPEELSGLHIPTGNEGGTDADKWIPGGHLPSGIPEAVIDIPHDATGWRNGDNMLDQSRWPGSWRELNL